MKFGRTGNLNTDINIRGGQETAFKFYRPQGFDDIDIPSHLGGIDFNKSVDVVKLNRSKQLYQYQTRGAPQGNYYSLNRETLPTQLGISPNGFNRSLKTVEPKVQIPYRTNQKVDALKSTARGVKDTWSVPGKNYPTTGGARQLFSGKKDAFDPDE